MHQPWVFSNRRALTGVQGGRMLRPCYGVWYAASVSHLERRGKWDVVWEKVWYVVVKMLGEGIVVGMCNSETVWYLLCITDLFMSGKHFKQTRDVWCGTWSVSKTVHEEKSLATCCLIFSIGESSWDMVQCITKPPIVHFLIFPCCMNTCITRPRFIG